MRVLVVYMGLRMILRWTRALSMRVQRRGCDSLLYVPAFVHCIPPSCMFRPCHVASNHINIVWFPCLGYDNYAELTSNLF